MGYMNIPTYGLCTVYWNLDNFPFTSTPYILSWTFCTGYVLQEYRDLCMFCTVYCIWGFLLDWMVKSNCDGSRVVGVSGTRSKTSLSHSHSLHKNVSRIHRKNMKRELKSFPSFSPSIQDLLESM